MHRTILFTLLVISASCAKEQSLDLYITNANVIDGTGIPSYRANVGIEDGRIVYISSDAYEGQYEEEINAQGRFLTPGFIDPHAHGNPLETPDFENFLAMGVTTIVLGQDGSGPIDELDVWKNYMDSAGTGVNVAMLLGHGSLRGTSGVLSSEDINAMVGVIEKHRSIVFGLSTGLEYSPGLYATHEELEVIAKHVPLVMSHMRNEDDSELLSSIIELAQQGKHTRVHIAHIKSVYGKGADRAEEILYFLDSLRSEGIDITADVYPYTASYTGISILFPEWSKTREQFELVKVNRRAELLSFLKNKIEKRNGPEATLFGSAPYAGKTLKQLAVERNLAPEVFLVDSIGPDGASAAYFVMDEELQERFIQDPMIAICSDGSPTGFHPRGHGTHARILEEFVRNREAISLEEAIRKMTSFPAGIVGINDRGIIREGYYADLVLFDLERVHERATFSNPLQLSEGFDLVLVNGTIARRSSMESRSGKYLMP